MRPANVRVSALQDGALRAGAVGSHRSPAASQRSTPSTKRRHRAATPLLHAVDAGTIDKMSTGMRVKARWVDEPQGAITDIACFEPEA